MQNIITVLIQPSETIDNLTIRISPEAGDDLRCSFHVFTLNLYRTVTSLRSKRERNSTGRSCGVAGAILVVGSGGRARSVEGFVPHATAHGHAQRAIPCGTRPPTGPATTVNRADVDESDRAMGCPGWVRSRVGGRTRPDPTPDTAARR